MNSESNDMNYRDSLMNSQIATVSKMIRLALRQQRRLGRNLWAKALELDTKATLNGRCSCSRLTWKLAAAHTPVWRSSTWRSFPRSPNSAAHSPP